MIATTPQAVMTAVHEAMVTEIGCGPFDGGCVAFAMAMQRVHGGDVYVLVGRTVWHERYEATAFVMPQHAVLRLPDGRFLDAAGCGDLAEVVESFSRAECLGRFELSGVRPIEPGDLPDAPCDEQLVANLTALLAGGQIDDGVMCGEEQVPSP